MNALWVLLLISCIKFLPLSGAGASGRLAKLSDQQLKNRASWARLLLRPNRPVAAAVVVGMPILQVGLSLLTDRGVILPLIEFAVWLILAAVLAPRLRSASWTVVRAARERAVELPARRSSAKARRNGWLTAGVAVLLAVGAILIGTLAGASTPAERTLVTTLGTASGLMMLAALVAGLSYYGDEKSEPAPLPTSR